MMKHNKNQFLLLKNVPKTVSHFSLSVWQYNHSDSATDASSDVISFPIHFLMILIGLQFAGS